jgi:hypothetical protein
MKHILTASLSFFLCSCAIGPLVSHETGRTLGKGGGEYEAGYGSASYVLKGSWGLTDDLDLGVQWEALSLGLRLKYGLVQEKEHGFSLAAAAGIGTSVGGSHYYGDMMASYLQGWWEPYFTLRIVHVHNDPTEFKDKETHDVDFTISAFDYNYGQAFLGSRFWFNKNWSLSVEVSDLFAFGHGVAFGKGVLAGAAFGYRY